MSKILVMTEEEVEAMLERVAERVTARSKDSVRAQNGRPLSLRQLAREYGVGRTVATRDIAAGKLKCIERRCPGGRMGIFIPVEEAERMYRKGR